MSLSKYFNNKEDDQGQPLFWGEADQFPYRGPSPPLLKGDQIDDSLINLDAKVDILKLPRDKDKYERIIDRCANGWYHLRYEKVIERATKDGDIEFVILISWLEAYNDKPRNTDI